MAWWRVAAVASVSLWTIAGCSGKSSSSDDDGGGSAESGASSGGSSGKGGSGAKGGSGTKGGSSSGGTSGKGGATNGGTTGVGGSAGTTPVGCDDLTSADARRIVVTNLGTTLREAVAGVGFVEGSQLIGRLLALGNRPGSVEFVESANDSIDDWMNVLETKVLADGNVETAAGPQVIYRMTSAVYCAPDPDDVAFDPEWAAEKQQDCADDLAEHPIWVTVTRVLCGAEEAVQILPEIGNAHIRPGSLLAHPHAIEATLDVAQAVSYVREQGDRTEFDTDSGGSIVGTLDTNDPANRFFEMSLSSPLVFGSTDNDEHTRVTMDSASFRIAADSVAHQASADLSGNAIAVTGALRALIEGVFQRTVAENVPRTESVLLNVPGVSAHCDYENESAVCTDLGLGNTASTVQNQEDIILDAALSSSAGPRFDVTFDLDADGNMRVRPDPDAKLELGYHLQTIADKLENIQQFALDDVVTFGFDGDTPSARLLVNDDGDLALTTRTSGSEVRVESGTFEMASEWAGQSVTVSAGQCLSYNPSSAVAHEILRGYGGVACDP